MLVCRCFAQSATSLVPIPSVHTSVSRAKILAVMELTVQRGENKPGVSELESAIGKAGHSMRVGERVQVNSVISRSK